MKNLSFLAFCFIILMSCGKKTDVKPNPIVIIVPNVPVVSSISDAPEPTTDKEYLEKIQKETFRYFWTSADAESGMAKERTTSGNTVTSGGTGFGVMATVVAVSRNWVPRAEAVARINRICDFLLKSDRFHGVFPHWYNSVDGKVRAFSTKDDGGDLVETSFLVAGLLTAKEYFNGTDANEKTMREKIQNIWDTVEWNWHVNNGKLYWHWSPKYNFEMNFPLKGYNETLITHVLAMASPKFAVTKQIFNNTWGVSKNTREFYGYTLDVGEQYGGPMFFSHYSFLGLDPHLMADNSANYWQQSLAHTMINRNYCVYKAPKDHGYSEEIWGLTSSDEPNGYSDHSASRDNGTIAPTAALASMPYTPFYSMQALKGFYKQKSKLYTSTGFLDAFNTKSSWVAKDAIAIDQGPIIIMIENYRTGLIWKNFMQISEIKAALTKMDIVEPAKKVGFPYVIADVETKLVDLMKHPESNLYELDYLADEGLTEVGLYNTDGTLHKTLLSSQMATNAIKKISFDASAGVYKIKLKIGSNEQNLDVKLR